MRFEVPQFLDIDDKLFGPFSFKQAVYLVGGGSIIYLLFKFLPDFFAFILALPVGAFALALVFYRPNSRPFMKMVGSFLSYSVSKKFYLWQHPQRRYETEMERKIKEDKKKKVRAVDNQESSKPLLKDIARGLDMLGKMPK